MRRFCLVLIKPSHYDDDGYVIQWFRSAIPSNSLAAIYGLGEDCAKRSALGPNVEIKIHAFDETNAHGLQIAGSDDANYGGFATAVFADVA